VSVLLRTPAAWLSGSSRRGGSGRGGGATADSACDEDGFREGFRCLSASLQRGRRPAPRSLVVTSPGVLEGKSTVAANLALAMADAAEPIALIDAAFRNPVLHRIFGVDNRTGLTEVVTGTAKISDVESLMIRVAPCLHLLCSGSLPLADAASGFRPSAFGALLEEISKRYSTLIFDCGAVLGAAEVSLMAGRVDGVILVLGAGSTCREEARRAIARLEHAGSTVLGTVLNRVSA